MNDQDYGVLLHDADDVLPLGLVGTPWEIIFKALRDVLKSGVGASGADFMRKACALYFLSRGDLEAVSDRDVLNGIAAALVIPYWVENFDDPKQASAVIYNWIKYKPTRANLTALALASGMRAFRLREIYTSTEFGISHTFGFDLGEGYETSFFAGPNAEPGLATAQRICGALTHFFLRIKDSPTLIVDTTYPDNLPHGAQFYFRQDHSEIRLVQGRTLDLYDENGELAQKIDEYAYYIPSVVRNAYGTNIDITDQTNLVFSGTGQISVYWGQPAETAYALFAEVDINIPDKTCCWLSVNHIDVNLAPNAIPGATLFDEMGEPITGEHWEIFAAYNQALDRLDVSALYLSGTDPVRIRANRYMTVCQVWLSYNAPPPPPLDDDTVFVVVDNASGDVLLQNDCEYLTVPWNNKIFEDADNYIVVEPPDYNLKVYGFDGGSIYLGTENNFMYVFDEPNNQYIMLNGGTSSTIWEIVHVIDTNGNEVSKESDYIWWINSVNIYYKASPTRPVRVAYILLKVTPPIS